MTCLCFFCCRYFYSVCLYLSRTRTVYRIHFPVPSTMQTTTSRCRGQREVVRIANAGIKQPTPAAGSGCRLDQLPNTPTTAVACIFTSKVTINQAPAAAAAATCQTRSRRPGCGPAASPPRHSSCRGSPCPRRASASPAGGGSDSGGGRKGEHSGRGERISQRGDRAGKREAIERSVAGSRAPNTQPTFWFQLSFLSFFSCCCSSFFCCRSASACCTALRAYMAAARQAGSGCGGVGRRQAERHVKMRDSAALRTRSLCPLGDRRAVGLALCVRFLLRLPTLVRRPRSPAHADARG